MQHQSTSDMPIVIVGAGLCGTLLAIRLAQRGKTVRLYERRPDMRLTGAVGGRSINLALSDRGLRGLRLVGVADEVLREVIPMTGRMIHPIQGEPILQPYSARPDDCINSVSRGGLNMILLNKADTYPTISTYFNTRCDKVDLEKGIAYFTNETTGETSQQPGKIIIGTDGAGSAVRQSMFAQSSQLRFTFSQTYLETGYKELHIPDIDGKWQLPKHALHIWPRGTYMMIALPNLDGSFTVTLFFPFEGENGFNALQTPQQVQAFFEKNFPDAVPLMPDLTRDYFANPTSSLGTVKCFPWQTHGKSLLMGDAAHAVVPFYGQGMNCSFEDVVVFDELLEHHDGDTESLLRRFQAARKPNTDAIADLAVDNFYEMRDHVANPIFIKKRQLELKLEQTYPDYFSKYALVTFREDVPYEYAMKRGRRQDELLLDWCKKYGDSAIEDLDAVRAYLHAKM